MKVEGIKNKVTMGIFVYHLTGFGQNYVYYGYAKRLVIACAQDGEIISDNPQPGELYYEDFVAQAKAFHLKLIEDHLTGFERPEQICWN